MPKEGCYTTPFVPILPSVGIYFNLVLAWETKAITWFHLVIYSLVGVLIYFLYGVTHSKIDD